MNRLKSLKEGEKLDNGANDGYDNKCQELEISHDSSENLFRESFSDSDTDSSREIIQNSISKKTKLFINLSLEELIECISEVAARYNVGIRPQTSIAATCRYVIRVV